MKDTAKGYEDRPSQESQEAQVARVEEEVEVFQVIDQNYFPENLLEESINGKKIKNEKDLLTELAIEAEIEITWSTMNGYPNELVQDASPKNGIQPMKLDEGESTTGLEIEENNEYYENAAAYFGFD
ncbi:28045_t:CDS:2 [Dentiscutata erythropus]|uniref:28045_t:CDS:1 n=1 Tax=Dentiscutata erythropus TaxID=1348616 RepID=A0A9N9NNM4_9GLOM|nr:28045_t:CDS:2 [Dentiscutata erythropus]